MKTSNLAGCALAVAALALVLGAACSGGDKSAAGADDVTLAAGTDIASTETSREAPGGPLDQPPALTASAGDQSVAVGLGTYCWTSPGGPGLCADAIGIVTGRVALPIGAGEAVTVSGDLSVAGTSVATGWAMARPTAALADGDDWLAWSPAGDDPVVLEIVLSGDTLTFDADLPPGRHIVAFFLDFPQGDASYGLLINVGATKTSYDPGGSLDRPPALIAFAGDQSVAVGLGTYCWNSLSGQGQCLDAIGIITGRAALPVGAGEIVTVTGDLSAAGASGVTGWVAVRPAEPYVDGGDWIPWHPPREDRVTMDIALSGDTVTFDADLPPGSYVVALSLDFAQGGASYGLLLDVQ